MAILNRTVEVIIPRKKTLGDETIIKMQEIFRELFIVSKLGLPVTLIYLTDVGMATIATIASGQ